MGWMIVSFTNEFNGKPIPVNNFINTDWLIDDIAVAPTHLHIVRCGMLKSSIWIPYFCVLQAVTGIHSTQHIVPSAERA
jgi:hypothetical protein